MPVSTINYKGKDIIYVDHRGTSGKVLVDNVRTVVNLVNQSAKSDFLVLVDLRDANLSEESAAYFKSAEVKEYSKKVKKEAVLGIAGIKKMVFNTYSALTGSKSRVFSDETEAKEYLIQ